MCRKQRPPAPAGSNLIPMEEDPPQDDEAEVAGLAELFSVPGHFRWNVVCGGEDVRVGFER